MKKEILTNNNEKISVLLKTNNSDNYLCETLESLKNFDEIIVLDFGSNDDTIEIAKEYKTKIIYVDTNSPSSSYNQALAEAKNEWILIVEENEIYPKNLIKKIEEYISSPKKNKNILALSIKTKYLEKEIKANRLNVVKVFKKGNCEFRNNLFKLYPTQKKVHFINKNHKINNLSIIKILNKDIKRNIEDILIQNKNILKNSKTKKCSIFFKPFKTFIYWYIFKKAILEGKTGLFFAQLKAFEEYILQVMILEKNYKGEENDN